MEIRTLGSTGLAVSRLGLGLAALGRPGYINLGHQQDLPSLAEADMQAHAHQVLDAAWAAGIRYFDAARSYGKAEAFLGSWLRTHPEQAHACSIGSKWGYQYTANWQVEAEQHEVKSHTVGVLEQQIAETRLTMADERGGNWVGLYQIHSATLDSGVLENQAVLARLAALKAEGWRIGLSLSGPQQAQILDKACTIQLDGERLFDSVQATWNLLEPSVGDTLAQAHAEGMGVIVKEALANGRLTARNQSDPWVSQLQQQADAWQCSLDTLALAAVLAQPWADVVLSGAANVAQLTSNLAALDRVWDNDKSAAVAALAEEPQHYWGTRAALAWN